MSAKRFIKRAFRSIVPLGTRATGGTYIEAAPANAAFKQLAAHATGGISKWGKMIELLAATANTTDCWIETLHIGQITAASGEYNIALTRETGTGTPTAAQIEAVLPLWLNSAIAGNIPIKPPIYIAAGQRIAAALAGTATKKLTVVATISRNR